MCLTLDLTVMSLSPMLHIEMTLKNLIKKSKYIIIESFTYELSMYEV